MYPRACFDTVQSYYERLAGIAEGATQTEPCESSATGAVLVQPPAPATAAHNRAKPPLPRDRRSPAQQEQRAPQQTGARTPSRKSAAAPLVPVEPAAAALGVRSLEQSRVSAVALDRQQAAASAKLQSRAEAKLRARLEELQACSLDLPRPLRRAEMTRALPVLASRRLHGILS